MSGIPEISPEAIIFGFVAVYLAFAVGAPLAAARNAAAVPLIGSCAQLVNGAGIDAAAAAMECGVGVFILYFVPGTIGVGWMVFQGR